MSKTKSHYVCQACGTSSSKWLGRCPGCSAWNSFSEEVRTRAASLGPPAQSKATLLAETPPGISERVPTGIQEFDRVLGGGLVPGSVTLIGGDPGVGKSTLLLQALVQLARNGHRVLYVTAEESQAQVAARALRIHPGLDSTATIFLLAESDFATIEKEIYAHKPSAVVFDSVQTMRVNDLESAAGTVSQLRELASRIVVLSKSTDTASFLIGHVTKDGMLAGPKVLEHLVDAVLSFEGERGQALRTLRAHKNRFGSAMEIGVFEMSDAGMRGVPSPSELFLAERAKGLPGSVLCATCEGARAVLVEIQALVSLHDGGSGRRTVAGVDAARLAMILAVLERRAGIQIGRADVFINVAGGLRIDEPATDLAVALAIASSVQGRPVSESLVAFGELGLGGEVRAVGRTNERLAEIAAMGFSHAMIPERTNGTPGVTCIPVARVARAIDLALG